ncbi:rRNA biogenesis protein RRP5 [Nannizzia gypsea CBS 118893]|uniref:rRNA biogenesis protein RRP5 n=1 Tax=Arthroderma gypseum (strain ATCC MYA-4604 / CBS 118893) TaxID=535722 RepID=E4UVW5_ARTGP|nr:rRNA biogenesis protein RRP5 [Nannizzia gypsea CBS 118893]EFR02442.1 rRNA biogenesis protein RRP5 [Nannizzia gypsea CBS 118893]
MAQIKRKGHGQEEPNSSAPKKKAKVDAAELNGASKLKKKSKEPKERKEQDETVKASKKDTSAVSKAAPISMLRDEQPAFPRGGNNVLTPLERKQIQIQATKDVLFEQKGKNGAEFANNDDEGSLGEEAEDKEGARAKPKKRKAKGTKTKEAPAVTKQGVKVESLTYKRIAVGSRILGQVSSIGLHDISLALPNNLTGFVPLNAISKSLTRKVEAMLGDDKSEDEEDEDDDFELKDYVKIGQYLRASVTATTRNEDDKKVKNKKHIELSIEPHAANSGLTKADMVVNATVQASVISVEDHGLIMDLGLEENEAKGFISSRELPAGVDISTVKEGSVFLCIVTGHNASGTVVKLSADLASAGSVKKAHFLNTAPTINAFLPGTAAEILITEVTPRGMIGKIMGMLDAVIDIIHSGASDGKKDLTTKYHAGAKIKGRLITTYPSSDPVKLGFSILDSVLKFSPTATLASGDDNDMPSISDIIPEVKVTYVDSSLGLYVQLGSTKHQGFVHLSRLADGRVDSISSDEGRYKVGSTHEGRIIGFSAMDNLFSVSLEPKIIEQPFLRLEDVTVGSVVKGKIEKLLVKPEGIEGLIVSLTDNISGLVPGMHMADTKLQHPEKKFREGLKVSVRVLSVDLQRRQLRLTLKKSLLNSDSAPWKNYESVSAGNRSPGTLIKIQNNGAIVQFYGSVKGFLPVSEMSEAYIKDPSQHFTVGQVVNVHALTVDAESERLVVSCKDPSTATADYQSAFEKIHPGLVVSGTVFEKSSDDLLIKLQDSGLIARLNSDHISDGSAAKRTSALNRIRVGQKMEGLLVYRVKKSHRLIQVTNKATLKEAVAEGRLPAKFEDIKHGLKVTGLIKNIIPEGIFVEFLDNLTGLIPKRLVDDDRASRPDFGYSRFQVISATVCAVQEDSDRFLLSLKPVAKLKQSSDVSSAPEKKASATALTNPVDGDLKTMEDIVVGRITKAKITSVKDTQLNVVLADNVQGRIDISEVFDSWEDIKDRKHPLKSCHSKEILPVRVLGIHDARNHKFLPISHRSGKVPVYELSTKPSCLQASEFKPLHLEHLKVGDTHVGYVNNIAEDCLWLNLSPNVRGRLRITDISDDISIRGNIQKNFPVGSAIQVVVTGVDAEKNRLDLSARIGESAKTLTVADLSKGMILVGRVTKVTDRQVLVQINDNVVGAVSLIDMADDYTKANPTNFHKNEALRVCVVDVDIPNKKISFSVRPSKVLSSSLPVADPEITSINQLKVGQIVRGFIRRVDNIGIFVTLGHNVTAYIRVSDLSDSFLKEWKDEFQVDQLIQGRLTVVDKDNNKIQMTLKKSALDPNYKPPFALKDLKVGQIVTGKVRKVEEYGAFIAIDGSANLSGLCHRSEMAEKRVEDATQLYEKDDIVKAKVLKVDLEKGQIALGLKASYFKDLPEEQQSEDNSSDDESGGIELDAEDDSDDDVSMGGVDLEGGDDEEDEEDSDEDIDMEDAPNNTKKEGLVTSGFDWTGDGDKDKDMALDDSAEDEGVTKRKKRRKAKIQVDKTGDLDANGPQSVADYERLLLGEPDSSLLWLKYMAFQLELGEVDKAREIAERALRTMSIGQDTEKLNVWVARLNLENTFGNDDTLDEVFKGACEYNDAHEIYDRMASIFIQSGKTEKADELFQAALKKKVSSTPDFFLNYANFLFDTMEAPQRGRDLLPRALQSLPPHTHVEVTSRFGQLEFRSPNGDVERGRTVFEGLLSSFPKRIDLWNVLLDLEIKLGDEEQVRRLFERVLGIGHGVVTADGTKGGPKKKLKEKQAKFLFKKWLAFEEKIAPEGDTKMVDEVKARAADYVRSIKGDA